MGWVFEVGLVCLEVYENVWIVSFEGWESLWLYPSQKAWQKSEVTEVLGLRTWCARTGLQTLRSMPIKGAKFSGHQLYEDNGPNTSA